MCIYQRGVMNPFQPSEVNNDRCDCGRVTWVDIRIIFFIFGLGFCFGLLFCGFAL